MLVLGLVVEPSSREEGRIVEVRIVEVRIEEVHWDMALVELHQDTFPVKLHWCSMVELPRGSFVEEDQLDRVVVAAAYLIPSLVVLSVVKEHMLEELHN